MNSHDGPYCYYLIETMTTLHPDGTRHYYPMLGAQDESGYYPTDWDYGTDFARAQEAVIALNARRGVSQDEATAIVASSMRAR